MKFCVSSIQVYFIIFYFEKSVDNDILWSLIHSWGVWSNINNHCFLILWHIDIIGWKYAPKFLLFCSRPSYFVCLFCFCVCVCVTFKSPPFLTGIVVLVIDGSPGALCGDLLCMGSFAKHKSHWRCEVSYTRISQVSALWMIKVIICCLKDYWQTWELMNLTDAELFSCKQHFEYKRWNLEHVIQDV